MLKPIINIYLDQIEKFHLAAEYEGKTNRLKQMIEGGEYYGDGRKAQLYFGNVISSGEVNINVDNMTQTGKLVFSRKLIDNLTNQINNGYYSQDRQKLEDKMISLRAQQKELEDKGLPTDAVDVEIVQTNNELSKIPLNSVSNVVERGDAVVIEVGYEWYDGENVRIELQPIFSGFISTINYGNPVEIDLEDFMFVLKNTSVPTTTWKTNSFGGDDEIPLWTNGEYDTSADGNSLEKMINLIFANSQWNNLWLDKFISVRTDQSKTSVGKWVINGNVSIMQFLEEIKNKCKLNVFNVHEIATTEIVSALNSSEKIPIKTFFNYLHCGIIKYYENNYSTLQADGTYEATNPIIFDFQDNIIDKNLEYKNINDVKIKLVAYSALKEKTGNKTKATKNKPSVEKTKTIRVLPALDSNGNDFIGEVGGDVRTLYFFPPEGEGGEYVDMKRYYVDPTSKKEVQFPGNTITAGWNENTQGAIKLRSATLRKQAEQQYHKLNSTSVSGSFTTFGMPFVKHGDIVQLKDKYNGVETDINDQQFLVKGVKTTFGASIGLRQEIMLDYSYKSLTTEEKKDLNAGKF